MHCQAPFPHYVLAADINCCWFCLLCCRLQKLIMVDFQVDSDTHCQQSTVVNDHKVLLRKLKVFILNFAINFIFKMHCLFPVASWMSFVLPQCTSKFGIYGFSIEFQFLHTFTHLDQSEVPLMLWRKMTDFPSLDLLFGAFCLVLTMCFDFSPPCQSKSKFLFLWQTKWCFWGETFFLWHSELLY